MEENYLKYDLYQPSNDIKNLTNYCMCISFNCSILFKLEEYFYILSSKNTSLNVVYNSLISDVINLNYSCEVKEIKEGCEYFTNTELIKCVKNNKLNIFKINNLNNDIEKYYSLSFNLNFNGKNCHFQLLIFINRHFIDFDHSIIYKIVFKEKIYQDLEIILNNSINSNIILSEVLKNTVKVKNDDLIYIYKSVEISQDYTLFFKIMDIVEFIKEKLLN